MGKSATEEYLLLDYPEEGEKVTVQKYMFRIEASCQAHMVQISVDRGPWRTCRPWAGFWWYEWSGYLSGQHQVVARVQSPSGHRIMSKIRRFAVDLETETTVDSEVEADIGAR